VAGCENVAAKQTEEQLADMFPRKKVSTIIVLAGVKMSPGGSQNSFAGNFKRIFIFISVRGGA